MKLAVLLVSLLPSYNKDLTLTKTITKSLMNNEAPSGKKLQIQKTLPLLMTFEAVYEVDISSCPNLCLEDAIECFSKSFPSLRVLKATYLIHFKTKKLGHLVQRCPFLHDIDLTVDTNAVIPSQVTIISSYPPVLPHMSTESCAAPTYHPAASLYAMSRSLSSNIAKLTLEGRIDVTGVSKTSLIDLISKTHKLSSLCLRGTNLVDSGLYSFSGSSLEMLDISCTEVSLAALAYIVGRNPGLTSLGARDCKNMSEPENRGDGGNLCSNKDLYTKLGRSCQLEDIAVGWGFSHVSLDALDLATKKLRRVTVGLGGSLDQDGLKLLAATCPLLDSITLYFQVLWDSIIIDVAVFFRHLQELSLCYCVGGISLLRFEFSMPNLRILRLQRVVRLMTNSDLVILTQNCLSLTELSLLGCILLDSDTQKIISSGWPGLTSIHLEDCGEVTTNGVADLLECYALEDLLLRHNGQGIQRNFILHAASMMPMLRKISLDLCDAINGDYDIPEFADRYFLSSVKIARCTRQKCFSDSQKLGAQRSGLHKETLVMAWDSESLTRTLVKERI